jgi:uncharacterized damage-inducible protein DinB
MTTQEQIDELECQRTALLARLSKLDSEVLNRKPIGGGWSVVQVISHVIQAELLSLEYLLKKTQQPELIAKSGPVAFLKSRALGLFLRLPFKVSAPARTAEVPERAELDALARDWEEVRSGWRDFLREFPAEHAGRAIYKHPRAGRLNLEQTLRFLIDHLRRHEGQIERVLSEVAPSARAVRRE